MGNRTAVERTVTRSEVGEGIERKWSDEEG